MIEEQIIEHINCIKSKNINMTHIENRIRYHKAYYTLLFDIFHNKPIINVYELLLLIETPINNERARELNQLFSYGKMLSKNEILELLLYSYGLVSIKSEYGKIGLILGFLYGNKKIELIEILQKFNT